MATNNEINHRRLTAMLPGIRNAKPGRTWRLKSEGYMDLVVEVIGTGEDPIASPYLEVSLAHYYEQNGDLMRDPEMVVQYHTESDKVVAESFRQDGGLAYESHSFTTDDEGRVLVYTQRLRDNNQFFDQWLRNLEAQGHRYNDCRHGDVVNRQEYVVEYPFDPLAGEHGNPTVKAPTGGLNEWVCRSCDRVWSSPEAVRVAYEEAKTTAELVA